MILYSGREGSSALVAHLRRHPRIAVPFFEKLDLYMLEREVPRAAWEHLPLALRRTLRGGRYEPAFFAPAEAGLPEPDAAGRQTVFKWRGWRLDPPVAAALLAEGAGLFLLNRRDLLNLNLSLYLTRHAIGGGVLRHPQFEALALRPDGRAALRAELWETRFAVDVAILAAEMRGQVEAKRATLGAVRDFSARGVPMRPIWYEDFLTTPEPILAGMLAALGQPWDAAVRESEYQKMSRPDLREQVENLPALERSSEIADLLGEW
ncbi:MAG: hypothetical protein K2X74_09255, partial [Acetobacteraceae bacterium]|nr:hypothetical protein [Acetobacteraceae bacterium]